MSKLLESDSDDGADGDEFKINAAYASRYDDWRSKEELQKLKDRHGDVDIEEGSEDESSSSDESVEAVRRAASAATERWARFQAEWTSEHEKGFLQTLAALKAGDPTIYDTTKRFFGDAPAVFAAATAAAQTAPPKMFLRDYERQLVTERDGRLSDDDDDAAPCTSRQPPTYAESQRRLQKSLAAVTNADSDDDDLLKPREKTDEQKKREDDDYLEWLKNRQASIGEDDAKTLQPLRDYWNDPSLSADDKFLKDFILNRAYEEANVDPNRIPTYDEIVGDAVELEEDERDCDAQEQFECDYNKFRFEDDDKEFIKAYPRAIKDSVRREDDRRKDRRDAYKLRKEKEKQAKREELRELKKLKRGEIMSKVKRLREASGNERVAAVAAHLNADFDPDEHDRKMQELFNEDYYGEAAAADSAKPVFSDSDSDAEPNWDEWRPEQQTTEEEEADAASTSAAAPDAEPGASTSGRRRRKRSKLAAALALKKPRFDPVKKSFEQYLDDYYQLDCEDFIGDTPCRFKYRRVPANDFGLSVDEIFRCEDAELNTWASVKKMSQYRTEREESLDLKMYQRKASNVEKKLRVLPSLQQRIAAKSTTTKKNSAVGDGKTSVSAATATNSTKETRKQRLKRKRPFGNKKAAGDRGQTVAAMSDERLRAYGLNPKKFRKKAKYTNKP